MIELWERRRGRSELHDQLAGMALRWFANKCTARGARGGYELKVRPGYVVDAAAIGSLISGNLKPYEYHWRRTVYTGHATLDYDTETGKLIKGYEVTSGDFYNYFLVVFEAKVSRADFLGTFDRKHKSNRWTPAAHLHFVVTPRGLLSEDDDLGVWGLLEKCGGGLTEIRQPMLCDHPDDYIDRLAHSILWLKPHRPWNHRGDPVPEKMRIPNL